jgi:hypothetical protein
MHTLKARVYLKVIHHPTYLLIIINEGLTLSRNKEFFSSFEMCFYSITLKMSLFRYWYSSQSLLFRLALFK